MPREKFEYRPLDNVMRGIEEPEIPDSPPEVLAHLTEQGMDPERIISVLKSRIGEKLQHRREERLKRRQVLVAQNVCRSLNSWTHPSIKGFAQGVDPVEKIIAIASSLVLKTSEGRTDNPIVDPFAIARSLSIPVCPRDNVTDARTVPTPDGRLQIEYNPHRSKARMRFSIAHELAHTFLPDCRDMIRNRASRAEKAGDEWQLEMLCNIGAAELLMPIATFPEIKHEALSIDHLMELRKRYEVGAEALLLRVVRLTETPCAIFAVSRREALNQEGRYGIDYILSSRSWRSPVGADELLPKESVVGQCTAIGFTAKANERWTRFAGVLRTECVGIPPYPNHRYPRVIGVLSPMDAEGEQTPRINEVVGDALSPRGLGPKIIAFIVNDKTPNWGASFARAVADKWPSVQETFRKWVTENRSDFKLGKTAILDADDNVSLLPMVCQHGFGASPHPRIRYGAVKDCLDQLAKCAVQRRASIHMPRLGSGNSRGLWPIISQIVDERYVSKA